VKSSSIGYLATGIYRRIHYKVGIFTLPHSEMEMPCLGEAGSLLWNFFKNSHMSRKQKYLYFLANTSLI